MDRLRKVLARPTAPLAVGLLFGALAAWLLVGPHAINPSNVVWLFGDDASYYSGWEQYRQDPHLHFPLSWTERIGYPVGTSVALLDVIPIAAVLLRPLSALLPVPFQYLGLWMLLSLVLQAYFGFSLARRLFPADPLFALIGSVFLLVSAPLAYRLCGHIAVSSQWLTLAALDAYFRDPGARPARWLWRPWVILALAAAINPYLAATCLLVVLGCVGRLVIEGRSTWRQAALYAAVTFVVVIASGATLGALVRGDFTPYAAGGYGRFSLNLNAPINPMESGSLLLPALSLAYPQQIDGYSYLGLGIIGLLGIGVLRRPMTVLWLSEERLLAIVGVAAACTLLAVSKEVTFGAHTLVTIPLPAALDSALQGLRDSGRLFLPAFYLISVAALSLTFWIMNPRYRLAILAAALALQVADLLPLYVQSRSRCDGRFETPLTSSAWSGLGRRFDNLILIPPYQCDAFQAVGGLYNYVYFGRLAALEHLRLNNYNASHYTHTELRAHCVDLLRAQLLGDLDPRSAYVVSDNVLAVWEVHGVRSHRCQPVDGVNLCTAVPPSEAASDPPPPPPAAPYALDTVLDLTNRDGDARRYLTFGWLETRSIGTWTEGPIAMIRLGLDRALDASRALDLEVDADPFIALPRHPTLDVDVVVNGRQVAEWSYSAPFVGPVRRARIPVDVFANRPGLDVELRIRNPRSPLSLGVAVIPSALGPRFLGLNVRSLVVRRAVDTSPREPGTTPTGGSRR